MDSTPASLSPPSRPLSYEDLRRFLFLVLGLVVVALLVHALADILMLFTVVFFMAMVLNPVVGWLEKRGLRRGLAVVAVMLSLVGILIGVGFLVVPPIIEQTGTLVSQSKTYGDRIEKQTMTLLDRFPQLRQILPPDLRDAQQFDRISEQLTPVLQKKFGQWLRSAGPGVGSNILRTSIGILGGIFTGVIALLLVSFVLGNPQPLATGFLSVVPARHREAAGRSLARIETQMMGWMRATLINGIITGVSTMGLLYLIGLPSAIVFGVLSFFGEFVPNIGPIAASLPALFVAAGLGTSKFVLTLAAILFVQQVESNLLVPFIMGRELELHPVTIVFFALSMGGLFGIAGAILAVPLASITKILVDEFVIKANDVPIKQLEARAAVLVSERRWPSEPSIG